MENVKTSKEAEECAKAYENAEKILRTKWCEARKELARKLDELDKPYEQQIDMARHNASKMRDKQQELFDSEQKEYWKNKMPPLNSSGHRMSSFGNDIEIINADFQNWYEYSDATKGVREHARSCNELIGRQPRSDNPNLKIMALAYYNEKVYLCFDLKKQKLVSWLFVRPSEHAGDYTVIYSDHERMKAVFNEPLRRWLELVGAKKEVD